MPWALDWSRPRKRPSCEGKCGCLKLADQHQEGTSKVKRNPRRPRITVTADGQGVVGHAGARLLCDLADAVGLTEGLSAAMAPTKKRRRGHDRGQVLVDLAVTIADG